MVEVCRRADQLANELAARRARWQRQLAALEALQIYAPMGHAARAAGALLRPGGPLLPGVQWKLKCTAPHAGA